MKVGMCILFGTTVCFVLSLVVNLSGHAHAERQDAATSSESKGLSVSPSIDRMGDLKPGKTYEREITAANSSNKDVAFKVLTSGFWVEDESYKLKWGVSDSQYAKIANWTNIDSTKTHTVKAGETYRFTYRITVPEDQAGGAQRLMVTISLDSDGDRGFIGAEAHINTLIFANVEGSIHPSAEIISQNIQRFSFTPSIRTTYTLKNTGNVDLEVTYKLYASGFFGGEQTLLLQDNEVLMTENTRMLERVWSDAPYLGIYNVTQEITVLGEAHIFTSIVVICPLWFIIVAALSIVLLLVRLIYKHKTRKKYRA